MARATRHSPVSGTPNAGSAASVRSRVVGCGGNRARSVSRRSEAQLAARVGRAIVSGVFPPGSLLPNAAEMGERFSASRTALREAYSRLSGKGLIVARPKIGTRVRPRTDWNLLDSEILAWHLSSEPEEHLAADLFELRRAIRAGGGGNGGGGAA